LYRIYRFPSRIVNLVIASEIFQPKMGKMMISLSDQAENLVRHEVEKVYHGRVGGLSIFFEQILRDYFQGNGKPSKAVRMKNGRF
jgi:hypothetical protein